MSPLELEGFGVTIGDYVINRIKKYFNSSPTEHQKKKNTEHPDKSKAEEDRENHVPPVRPHPPSGNDTSPASPSVPPVGPLYQDHQQ